MTHDHLPAVGGLCLWQNFTEEEKKVGLGSLANNDVSESSFGGLAHNVERFGMIGLAHAGGIALARQNGTLNRDSMFDRNKKKCMCVAQNICVVANIVLQMRYMLEMELCTQCHQMCMVLSSAWLDHSDLSKLDETRKD